MMDLGEASSDSMDEQRCDHESNKRRLSPSPTKNSPLAKKSHPTVQPILFVAPSIIGAKDSDSSKKLIAAELKKLEIEIERVQITLGRNVLVHAKNIEAKNKLLDQVNLFGSVKSIDFSQRDNRPALILKGISFKDAQFHLENGDLSRYGVTELVAFKSRSEGKEPKIVKILFSNFEERKQALVKRYIVLDYFTYYLEEVGAQPKQCRKCKKYGHFEKECNEEIACAKCGNAHESNDCTTDEKRCVNCNGKHSAFWRGCPSFKVAHIERTQKNVAFVAKKPLTAKSTTTRTYSQTIQSPTLYDFKQLVEVVNGINGKIEELSSTLTESLSKQAKQISLENN
jgi:hypothetical protein